MSRSNTVTARIACEVEIEVGTWQDGTTFDALRDQVKREGVQILAKTLRECKVRINQDTARVKFIMVEE